ncbi:MAG: type II 3-dehydroquinate dehydratase [Bacteroidales bacterium]|nr:type II 3-dehydroquinate dehydratase [Bacteroidales bacterium]
MKKQIAIINGPNLNLIGKREPNIYGNINFEDYYSQLQNDYTEVELDYFQSNHEGDIIDYLHKVGYNVDGIVLNAGAYTHTSVAIADAIKAIKAPVIEVHISNIFNREDFRKQSYISAYCLGIISGFGLDSYRLALESLK